MSKLSNPPCARCGYNGVGYYQPGTHECAQEASKPLTDLVVSLIQQVPQPHLVSFDITYVWKAQSPPLFSCRIAFLRPESQLGTPQRSFEAVANCLEDAVIQAVAKARRVVGKPRRRCQQKI